MIDLVGVRDVAVGSKYGYQIFKKFFFFSCFLRQNVGHRVGHCVFFAWMAASIFAPDAAAFVCVSSAVVVTLEPLIGAETYVNGKQITEAVILKQGAHSSGSLADCSHHLLDA